MEMTIEQKLDALAEYHSQKDSIEAKKREMLNEVKTPDEVIDIQRQADEAMKYYDELMNAKLQRIRDEAEARLSEVQIPPEIRAALAEIDRKRKEIGESRDAKHSEIMTARNNRLFEMRQETERKTRQVFADLAQRKADIEAEFLGKAGAVDENIKALEAEIKAEVIKRAAEKLADDIEADNLSVKSTMYHAVYTRGRVTWKAEKLDSVIKKLAQITREIDAFVANDQLGTIRKMVSDAALAMMKARKEGEPSVALRKI